MEDKYEEVMEFINSLTDEMSNGECENLYREIASECSIRADLLEEER